LEMIRRGQTAKTICRETGLRISELSRIREMMKASGHKRERPEVCEL